MSNAALFVILYLAACAAPLVAIAAVIVVCVFLASRGQWRVAPLFAIINLGASYAMIEWVARITPRAAQGDFAPFVVSFLAGSALSIAASALVAWLALRAKQKQIVAND